MHSEQAGNDQRWTSMLRKQLLTAEVELVAPLGSTELALGEVAKLKVGDIVPIDIGAVVSVKVDDVPLMSCRYGINHGQYALKVEKFLTPETATE